MTKAQKLDAMKREIAGDYLVTTSKMRTAARRMTLRAYRSAPGSWLPTKSRWRRVTAFPIIAADIVLSVGLFLVVAPHLANPAWLVLLSFALLVPGVLLIVLPLVQVLSIFPYTQGGRSFHLLDPQRGMVMSATLKGDGPYHIQATGLWAAKRSDAIAGSRDPGTRSRTMVDDLIDRAREDGRVSSIRAHAKNQVLLKKVYMPRGFEVRPPEKAQRSMHIPIRLTFF